MREETKFLLIGAGALFLLAKCAVGGSLIEVHQDVPRPTPTVTVTKVQTKTKTTVKQKSLPESCRDLTESISQTQKDIKSLGASTGAMQDAGNNLLSAMARQDRKEIVSTTEHYTRTYSDISTGLTELEGSSSQLSKRLANCMKDLKEK